MSEATIITSLTAVLNDTANNSKLARPAGSTIFVTGVPRCGSSWVGSVLTASPTLRYVYEPFNPHWSPRVRGVLGHFKYLPPDANPRKALQQASDQAFAGALGLKQLARAAYRGYLPAVARSNRQVLVKDPTAVLMTGWLARRHSAQVLIITRHPCGFASSLAALGWTFSLDRLLGQERLMRDHLQPFESTLRAARNDPWHSHGAFWAAVHHVLKAQHQDHPEWIFLAYEDICADSARQFGLLARSLKLDSEPLVEAATQLAAKSASNSSGSTRRHSPMMADIWRQRLSAGEVDAVLGVVRDFGLGDRYAGAEG